MAYQNTWVVYIYTFQFEASLKTKISMLQKYLGFYYIHKVAVSVAVKY